MTDKKLITDKIVTGCKSGDSDSFSRLVDIYSAPLYNYFYSLIGNTDTAGELLSELFLKLVEKIGTYSGKSFNGWIFTIASNLFYDHLRSQTRRKKLLEQVKNGLIEEYYPSGASDDLSDALRKNLRRLDTDTAELITLRYYSQMSFSALASSRHEPIGTTLSKVHRGLKRLRELMESEK